MKKQLKFKVTRKGYDIAEVDNFLNLEADKNEEIHAQQRERIVELVNEISDLKRQLKDYRDREGQTIKASLRGNGTHGPRTLQPLPIVRGAEKYYQLKLYSILT